MDEMNEAVPEMEAEPDPPLPSLPARFLQVFFSPGDLFVRLREDPRWFGAMVVVIVLTMASMAAIPAEVWQEFMRQQMLQTGQTPPAGVNLVGIQRVIGVLAPVVGVAIVTFVSAGLLALLFTFILGDEGRYKQYLAVVTHAGFISAVGQLVALPIRISQADLRTTLNLGLFTPFLSEGYLHNLLHKMDMFGLWGLLIMALGVASLDEKRSWESAATVLLTIFIGLSAVVSIWI